MDDLEDTLLSEISQSPRQRDCAIPLPWVLGWGGVHGELCWGRGAQNFSFNQMKSLEMVGGDGFLTLTVISTL